jgi:hypothetical protein
MSKSRALLLAIILIVMSVGGNILWIDHIKNDVGSKARWPTTKGTVLNFNESRDFDDDEIWFSAEFIYEIGGLQYSEKQNWIVGLFEVSHSRRYTPGESVTVYYDPEKPEIAVINLSGQSEGSTTVSWFLLLGGLIAVIYAIYNLWSNRHKPW